MAGVGDDEIAFLQRVRGNVSDSAEFRALASSLYNGVREALRSENWPSFGSMVRGEQEALLNRVRTQLLEEEAYTRCRDVTWRALDAALDAEADALLSKRIGGIGGRRGPGLSWPAGQEEEEDREERNKQEPSGKVGVILELASTSASHLLDRWPAAQDELLWLLNTELPTALRRAVWALKLRAPAARAEYERKRSESVFATLSLRDGAVRQGCQATLQTIAPAMIKLIPFLKTCLSYADSLRPLPPPPSGWPSAQTDQLPPGGAPDSSGGSKPSDKPLAVDASSGAIHTAPLESFWGVPLLRVFVSSSPTRTTTEQAELETTLIEHFLALLSAPKPLLGLAADQAKKGAKGKKGPTLTGPPSAEKLLIGADEELSSTLSSMLGVTGIDAMLLPYAQRLAVGFFSTEVTAFVWDLCILTGWHQLQPALAAALICMRVGLLTCSDVNGVKGYIAAQATSLSIDQMQRALDTHFMAEIRKAVHAPPPQQAFELTPGGSWS